MAEQGRNDFYVGANMFVYYSVQQARTCSERGDKGSGAAGLPRTGRFLGGRRRPDRERKVWIAWEEGGRLPDVIVELLSPSTAHKDRNEIALLIGNAFCTTTPVEEGGFFVKRDDSEDDAHHDPDYHPHPTHQDQLTRRIFLGLSLTAVPAVRFAAATARAAGLPAAKTTHSAAVPSATMPVRFQVNGQERQLQIDPRTSLLDALREQLALTGTKKGCDHGQCGACTVLVDGRRVLSCLTLAAMALEGEGHDDRGPRAGRRAPPGAGSVPRARRVPVRLLHAGPDLSAVALLAEGRAGRRRGRSASA